MIDLELALADLGEHLDHPAGDGLADAVRERLIAVTPIERRRTDRSRSLAAVAAVFVLIVATALAIPPARHAIADWLGIGAIEVRRSEGPPPSGGNTDRTVPGSPGSTSRAVDVKERLAEARTILGFDLVTVNDSAVGPLQSVAVDRTVPGGLVALGYPRFTLVEVASFPPDPQPLAKFLGRQGARAVSVTVDGRPGLWITGSHSVAYLDREGRVRTESVRRSGPVLIWERGGVTYRIEGIDTLVAAQQVAALVG